MASILLSLSWYYIIGGVALTWMSVVALFSTSYVLVWFLEGKKIIAANPIDTLFLAGAQWVEQIASMDVPGAPIRYTKKLIAYYYQDEVFDPKNEI